MILSKAFRRQNVLPLAFLLVIVMFAPACGGSSDEESPEAEEPSGTQTASGLPDPAQDIARLTSLELADQIAEADPNLQPGDPLVVPVADFSGATMETEPNDTREEATPMGDSLVARGAIGDQDTDFFSFEVEGEPQRWLIEATGESLNRILYHSTTRETVASRKDPDAPNRNVIANLFLLPGTHYVEMRRSNTPGDYTLRAVPLGPPDPLAEREPNNDKEQAHRLTFGVTRTGHLFERRDYDYYRFSLGAEEQVLVQLVPPPGVKPRLFFNVQSPGGGVTDFAGIEGDTLGTKLVYRAKLDPGEYIVEVLSMEGGSDRAYALRLDRLDPFAVPTDLEPNDALEQARPLPRDLIAEGHAGEHRRDRDWYRLPALTAETQIVVTPSADVLDHFNLNNAIILYDEGASRVSGFGWNREDSVYTGTLPANTPLYAQVLGEGPYRFEFAFDPGPGPTPLPAVLPVAMTMPPGPHTVAAYWHEGQRVELPVTLENQGSRRQTLTLEAVSSHPIWQPQLAQTSLSLDANAPTTVPLTLRVTPDAWATRPVTVTVRAVDEQGNQRTTQTVVDAVCGAPPVAPGSIWPVPEALLGGLNVAATALGSTHGEERREERLFDGMTPNDAGWITDLPATTTVELAGSGPVQIAGVLLHPQNNASLLERAKDFDVLISTDGQTFTPVHSGTLSRHPIEQAFVFEAPVEARFVRLHVRSSYKGTKGRVNLGELKVVAAPGVHPFEEPGFNLADPALGGHVVWSDPLHRPRAQILTEETEGEVVYLDHVNPNAWVIGLHHQRAAQVTELQWTQTPREGGNMMSKVQVSISTESPLGPWTPLPTWTLDTTAGSTSTLTLPEPVWARYVRFTNTEPVERSRWFLPETIRIHERPADATYRSILGQWGHYGRAAIYEKRSPPVVEQVQTEADDNDSRDAAQALALNQTVQGTVVVGEDEDWYRLQIPGSDNRLSLDIQGNPVLRARFTLYDAAEQVVPLEKKDRTNQPPLYEAAVEPGGTYFLHLEEPPRSIAFVWDNSGSVSPYKQTIYQTMAQFAEGIQPGREYANLWPFSNRANYLREEWADQPTLLLETLNAYDRRDGSSSAEENLYNAVSQMSRREGTKAVVLLTDADSPSYNKTALLWQQLAEVQPRIFTLELHRGGVARHQDLMQTWAGAGQGFYAHFNTNADLDVGFERAACHIRRPARYRLTTTTRFEEPPGPGLLVVKTEEEAVAQGAIELILDASGSMLQRLEGKRRIAIARDVLTDLVTNTLPAGTPLALRIFGHRTPDACQTDLDVPLAPLDPDKVAGIIAGTNAMNLAKTPIAQSLELVMQDLEGVEGRKLILLITDGEETCDGDPAAAVQALKDAGFDIRLNIIGFAIDDAALKSDFETWADLGGGRYFDAQGADELSGAVREALRPKFQVFDATGTVVVEGTVNSEALEVPAGAYTIKVLTSPPQTFEAVEIAPEQTLELEAAHLPGPP